MVGRRGAYSGGIGAAPAGTKACTKREGVGIPRTMLKGQYDDLYWPFLLEDVAGLTSVFFVGRSCFQNGDASAFLVLLKAGG